MKIGTDGVLLGSIAARFESKRTLDVGTGCGLIALMIAQKSSAQVIALEIDKQASETASLNVNKSPWSSRIMVKNQSFQEFSSKTTERFDLIVCNPPFFHNSQLTPIEERNLARHSHSLRPEDLLEGVKRIIAPKGNFLVIIPFDQESCWFNQASENGLHPTLVIHVFSSGKLKPKRSIIQFSTKKTEPKVDSLVIEVGQRHAYSEEFIEFTKDYYLFL